MGTMLVEIMRANQDELHHKAGPFVGPFPSGDTVIYIDTVACLGHSAGFIGAVAKDDFGRCLLDRFARDSVDLSCGEVLSDHTADVASVAYFGNGKRYFIFHSAAGQLRPDYVQPECFRYAKLLHLTGCNAAVNPSARDDCLVAM